MSNSKCHKEEIKLHNPESTYCSIHNTCMYCYCGCYKKSDEYKDFLESKGGNLTGGLY